MTEAQEQRCLFEWANLVKQEFEELELMYHIPNGGKRDKKTAVNLKREGVKAGVPDICLPVARGQYHGLYIELKTSKGKVSKNQKIWLENLDKQGYATIVCYGWLEAKEVLKEYLKNPNI